MTRRQVRLGGGETVEQRAHRLAWIALEGWRERRRGQRIPLDEQLVAFWVHGYLTAVSEEVPAAPAKQPRGRRGGG